MSTNRGYVLLLRLNPRVSGSQLVTGVAELLPPGVATTVPVAVVLKSIGWVGNRDWRSQQICAANVPM